MSPAPDPPDCASDPCSWSRSLLWSLRRGAARSTDEGSGGSVGRRRPAPYYKTGLRACRRVDLFWDDRWYGGVYGPHRLRPRLLLGGRPCCRADPGHARVGDAAADHAPRVPQNRRARTGTAAGARAGRRPRRLPRPTARGPFLLGMALTLAGMALLAASPAAPRPRSRWGSAPVHSNPLASRGRGPLPGRRPGRSLPVDGAALSSCALALAPFLLTGHGRSMALFGPPVWLSGRICARAVSALSPSGGCGLLFSPRCREPDARSALALVFFFSYAVICAASFALPAAALGNNVGAAPSPAVRRPAVCWAVPRALRLAALGCGRAR